MIYWSILNDTIVKILNRLDPERFEWKFRLEIFKLILVTDGCGIYNNVNGPNWRYVNSGSGNSLVPHWRH